MLGHVIKSRAEETPEQVAISVEGHHLTYAEFQATIELMSDRIARLLVPLPSAATLFRLHPCDAWAAMIALRGCGIDTSATDDPELLDALPFDRPLVIYANKAPATGGTSISPSQHRLVSLRKHWPGMVRITSSLQAPLAD